MSNARELIAELARPRVQMSLALEPTHVGMEQRSLLESWLATFPTHHPDGPNPLDLAVAVSLDLREVTWRVAGPTERMLFDLRQSFDLLGVATERRELFGRIGEELYPERVGAWLQVGADTDAAWSVPGLLEVGDLDDLVPLGLPADLPTWCRDVGADAVVALEGGLGATEFVGVTVRPAQQEPFEDPFELDRLLRSLGAAVPADLVVAMTDGHVGDHWMSATFDAGGLLGLSVLAVHPAASLTIALARAMSIDDDGLDRLAAVDAALGGTPPALVGLEIWADGIRIRRHHTVTPL
jgi:hypothetical protein